MRVTCAMWKARALAAEAKLSTVRSKKWPAFKRKHLKKENSCQYCGSRTKLEVHHIVPFHVNPKLELSARNLITLCESDMKCHIKIGHLGNWRKINPNVRQDCVLARTQVQSRGFKRKSK